LLETNSCESCPDAVLCVQAVAKTTKQPTGLRSELLDQDADIDSQLQSAGRDDYAVTSRAECGLGSDAFFPAK